MLSGFDFCLFLTHIADTLDTACIYLFYLLVQYMYQSSSTEGMKCFKTDSYRRDITYHHVNSSEHTRN